MTDQSFADRLAHVRYSPSMALIGKVRERRRQGIEIIDFGQQQATPELAIEAASAMLRQPAASFYADPRGIPTLRQTIAEKLAAKNSIEADPESEIVVTVGAKQALFACLLALVDRGDEVLLEDPGYVSFEPLVRLTGATPVPVPLSDETAFRLSVNDIRKRITSRTRLLILCNPHNPTGRCLSRHELEEVAALVREFDLRVLVDEAYEHFVYDDTRHVSLASLPGMPDRTLTVQTVSKIYNMAGWRVGWAAGPADILSRVLTVHSHTVTCPTTFAQAGAEAVIRAGVGEGGRPITEIVQRYARQRDAMIGGLRGIPGVSCTVPDGGYFVFPSFKSFGMTSVEMSDYLLDAAKVAATPGSAFGSAGEGHLRMVIKSDVEEIARGIERVAAALAGLGDTRARGLAGKRDR